MNQQNGFKQNKTPSTKDRMRALEINLKNSQQAVQISQMMIKQLMQQIDMLRQDVNNTLNRCNDLQYRTLAMINIGSINVNDLDAEADKLKLKDYNEASDKEDIDKGYTVGDEIRENSIVILTSTTDHEDDKGIFRSKIPVAQIPFEQMKKDLLGKKVGDIFDTDINGVNHHVEIVGIREFPKKLEIVDSVAEVIEGAEVECCGDCDGDCCGCDDAVEENEGETN